MKRLALAVLSLMLVMGFSAVAYAGPGSVVIKTDGDITARFGAQVRFVPTYEQNWALKKKESWEAKRSTSSPVAIAAST